MNPIENGDFPASYVSLPEGNISVDNSLIYHQIAVFHPKMVEEFAHQPNDLESETR